jgi:hypothetical protein
MNENEKKLLPDQIKNYLIQKHKIDVLKRQLLEEKIKLKQFAIEVRPLLDQFANKKIPLGFETPDQIQKYGMEEGYLYVNENVRREYLSLKMLSKALGNVYAKRFQHSNIQNVKSLANEDANLVWESRRKIKTTSVECSSLTKRKRKRM